MAWKITVPALLGATLKSAPVNLCHPASGLQVTVAHLMTGRSTYEGLVGLWVIR
jgi:hypothetical protein